MGKRQIGQLQPSEFVVTILISEIVAMPIENPDLPMLNSIISVMLLVAFEIIFSCLSLKSTRLRSLLQGNSVLLIKDGRLNQKRLKSLRYSIDDLLEALRKKDVFDLESVQYAVAETDGTLSVQLKPCCQPLTKGDLQLSCADDGLPTVVIADGRLIFSDLDNCELTRNELEKFLKKEKIESEKIMLMTITRSKKTNIIPKENKE